jgi:hypothetical protein
MNSGKTTFAQRIDFIPSYEFRKCVARCSGNYRVKSFSCCDQFLTMAFARLTYRESLRDIEASLRLAPSQALSHGLSRKDFTQHPIQCKSNTRLAHLRRFCSSIDFHSSQFPCRRRFRSSSQENRLRIGCNDYRSLFLGRDIPAEYSDERWYEDLDIP